MLSPRARGVEKNYMLCPEQMASDQRRRQFWFIFINEKLRSAKESIL